MAENSRDCEVRHMDYHHILRIGEALDRKDLWMKFMLTIPKDPTIPKEEWTRKYRQDDIYLIINTYNQHSNRRSMTQILFDEWGSSGRRRPRVSDLLQILVKAQLYRIADYVAFNVLNVPPPERPKRGPARRIEISGIIESESDVDDDVESIMNQCTYPSSKDLKPNEETSSNMTNNKDYYEKIGTEGRKDIAPHLVEPMTITNNDTFTNSQSGVPNISELLRPSVSRAQTQSDSNNSSRPQYSEITVSNRATNYESSVNSYVTGDGQERLPRMISETQITLQSTDNKSVCSAVNEAVELPNLSLLGINSAIDAESNSESQFQIPAISILRQNSDENINESNGNIPQLSFLHQN